jgi:hypothetical protein
MLGVVSVWPLRHLWLVWWYCVPDIVGCIEMHHSTCLLCSALFCSVLFCSVLFCAVLCCAVLCCAVLCCAVLCCAVLCCAVLFCYASMFTLIIALLCVCVRQETMGRTTL